VDLNIIALEYQARIRAADLRRDRDRSRLVPPVTFRSAIAGPAGAIRRLSERIERWADRTATGPIGRQEWRNS